MPLKGDLALGPRKIGENRLRSRVVVENVCALTAADPPRTDTCRLGKVGPFLVH